LTTLCRGVKSRDHLLGTVEVVRTVSPATLPWSRKASMVEGGMVDGVRADQRSA